MEIVKDEKEIVPLKKYNLKQLSELYGVNKRTMARWLKPFETEIGKRIGYYFSVAQVKTIFQKLDLPSGKITDDITANEVMKSAA